MVVTVLLLTGMWMLNRGPTTPAVSPADASTQSPVPIISDPLAPENPVFLEGPTTPDNPIVVQIGVPAQDDSNLLEGLAGYQRTVGSNVDTCASHLVPFNSILTVTNIANGRVLSCVNRAPEVLGNDQVLLLSIDQFITIAELVDSPIHVSITWQ